MTDTPIHFAVGDRVVVRSVRSMRNEEDANATAKEVVSTVAAVTESGKECYVANVANYRFDTLTGRCVSDHPRAYLAIRKARYGQ